SLPRWQGPGSEVTSGSWFRAGSRQPQSRRSARTGNDGLDRGLGGVGKRSGACGVLPAGAPMPGTSPLDERCSMPVPLSVLDLATATRGQTPAEALEGTVALARKAEETGYGRVWYAEHHNMASIASSATSVLI